MKTSDYEDVKYSEYINDFLSFIRTVEQEHNIAIQQEKDADYQTQDLLHNLELNDENNYHDYAKISKALKQIRKERRMAKNKVLRLYPILDWIEANPQTIKNLQKLLGEVRKTEKKTSSEGLYYVPKTDVLEGM